jgi:hypothetical protein
MLTLKEDTMLGDVPDGWNVKPLDRVLSAHYPGDWGAERGPHMIRVLRSTNLTNDGSLDLRDVALRALAPAKAGLLAPKRHDILLERSGGGPGQPVGRVGFVNTDMSGHGFSNFLHLLRPDPTKINARFLAWVLYSVNRTGRVIRLEQQTTQMRNLHFRDYLTMPLPIPPLAEQAAIGRILDAADVALANTRERIDGARRVKNAVLQQFFYQALGETAYANRPAKELPIGWHLISMEDLLAEEPKNGVSPNASSQPPGIPTFSIAAIRHGRVDLDTVDHLKYTRLPDAVAERFRVRRGDVLIVRGNANPDLVGKAGIVSGFPRGCIYPDIAKRVVFRADGELTVSPEFGVLAWNHAVVHNQVLRRAKTSNGTLKINTRDIKQIVMPVPTQREQTDLGRLMSGVDVEIDALRAIELAQQQLKRSLMHDLLTGRVRVQREARAAAL